MNTDRLDDIKSYCMVVDIFVFIGVLLLGADLLWEYQKKGLVSDVLFGIWIIFCVIWIVLLLIYYALRAYLKRKQKDAYIGASHMAGEMKKTLFPPNAAKGELFAENEEEIRESVLWKTMASGLNGHYLLYFIACFGFGSLFLWTGFYMFAERGTLALVLGILLGIICYFWALVNFFAIPKKAGNLLQYPVAHDISFDELNRDFLCAQKLGSQIWIGKRYFFIYTNAGAHVMALSAISSCQVHVAGSIKRLPHYWLEVQCENEKYVKYAVFPFAFYRAKEAIEQYQSGKYEKG